MFHLFFRPNNEDIPVKYQRAFLLAMMLTFSTFVFSFIIGLALLLIKTSQNAIIYCFSTSLIFLLIFFVVRNGHLKIGFYSFAYLICINSLLGITAFGWKSLFFLYIFLLVPTLFFNAFINKIEQVFFISFFVLVVLVAIYLSIMFPPMILLSNSQLQILCYSNSIIMGASLAFISFLDNRNAKSIAKKLVEANEKLAYQASRDPLTNLLNRRSMNELIEKESDRSKRSGKSYGLIIADIDDFKQVNDQYGHSAGDFVLVQMSGIFQSTLRKQDSVARWGGEEFLMMLPETDEIGAQVAAEKLREIIAHSIFYYAGNSIKVTVSFGHIICEPEYDWVDALKRADKALYFGKQHGKNVAIQADHENIELAPGIQISNSSTIE